ncbi:monovalent cation/H(+) antiporter subunit G [Corynebacterium callunae]|uniref:monovalent cation/H(+) antiporter subunit G n=1 Tax=Corynebacterium callunae TaxID=1721 RepID=UPI00103F0928|nr:monovalent cation/H(+) antiporter subunit G [Corynebacterium callunae]MCK2199983.1 monovalent cation/H(+) antiporter subunit G [Corynebacterium callunae]
MSIQLITDIVSLVFIILGAFLSFSASVGLLRFKDSMSRVHAMTKPQTTGLILTVAGAVIRILGHEDFNQSHRSDLGLLVLLVIFALLTSPVTAQRVGRVSRREGLYGAKEDMTANAAPAEMNIKGK